MLKDGKTENLGEDVKMAESAPQNHAQAFQKMLADMRPLFWDTDPDQLDMKKNSAYIIARLLDMGGMPGYLWVQYLFTKDEIIQAVIQRKDMRPVVRNFMASQYHIPADALLKAPAWR